VTKVWRKSINRYWRYSGNMKIWDAFGHAVTLNFDLLTQNLIRSSLSRDAPVTKVWRKSVNRYWRYRGNIKLPRESRMDGRTHGRTTRKHIASAGAYRRRRLKNQNGSCLSAKKWIRPVFSIIQVLWLWVHSVLQKVKRTRKNRIFKETQITSPPVKRIA